MKLAICTDVFADLSYTDMLDKVKSLGIDAVEMTAGGWGARKHCNTAELLADEGKRKEFMGELEKRGMRISALNTSCNPLWPSKTGEEYKKSMYDCATLAGLLGVKKIVAMAGLPAGSETDTTPNWITSTVSWPDFMAPASSGTNSSHTARSAALSTSLSRNSRAPWFGLLRLCSSCVRLPTRCSASTSIRPT